MADTIQDLTDKLEEPYRIACPRGHTVLVPHETTDTTLCRVCHKSYPNEKLVDKAEK